MLSWFSVLSLSFAGLAVWCDLAFLLAFRGFVFASFWSYGLFIFSPLCFFICAVSHPVFCLLLICAFGGVAPFFLGCCAAFVLRFLVCVVAFVHSAFPFG